MCAAFFSSVVTVLGGSARPFSSIAGCLASSGGVPAARQAAPLLWGCASSTCRRYGGRLAACSFA